jgi:FKBP-type peptidyl-prolyl cis-trans isomerase FklB
MTKLGVNLRLLAAILCLTAGVFGGAYSVLAQDEQEVKSEAEVKFDEINIKALKEFGQQEGVIKRASGLLIKVITRGDGGIVSPNAKAIVHYEGSLADGTVFDSSYARGRPANIPVNGVIKGWQEALLLMQIGSKWEVALPADIAYGKDGQRGIPPNANLFFTMELIGGQ